MLTLPWLLAQGRHVRRTIPRLPEAAGAHEGVCRPGNGLNPGAPLQMLAIGESPVAGVGVATQEQAITAQYASLMAVYMRQPVHWRAFGKNGATVADALTYLIPLIRELKTARTDIVLIAFGVNDTTAFHGAHRYRRDLSRLIATLDSLLQPRLFVVTGVPPLHLFPALPQPLRLVLGMKARVLSRVAQQLTQSHPRAIYVPVQRSTGAQELMAVDGYHPCAAGVHLWARQLALATVTSGLPA